MKRFFTYYLCLMFVAVVTIRTTTAQKFTSNEVKAAFVFNFIKFATWPQQKSIIKIGLVGNTDFTNTILQKLKDQKIDGVPLDILFITDSTQLSQYDVIVYDNSINGITPQTIKTHIKGKPVLTIGNNSNFVKKVGIIAFIEGTKKSDKYKFIVNLSTMRQSGIKLSSKLLTLAEITH